MLRLEAQGLVTAKEYGLGASVARGSWVIGVLFLAGHLWPGALSRERQFAGFKTDGVFPIGLGWRRAALRGRFGNGMLQDVDQDFLECRNRFGFEVFAFERGQGVEEQLADVGKRRGSARGNGVASQSLENLAEGAIDVGGRVKLLDGQEEFHGAAVSGLLVEILTLVIEAKRYVFTGTRRRATASVGGDVGTTGIEIAGIGHGGVPFCSLECRVAGKLVVGGAEVS